MGDDVETFTAVMHKDKADTNIMERAKKIMKEQDPDLFIVQMIGTDQTGHSQGVLYDEYLQKIHEADVLIEDFVAWLTEGRENGQYDSYSFVRIMDRLTELVDMAI